jgi:hypothetical protein
MGSVGGLTKPASEIQEFEQLAWHQPQAISRSSGAAAKPQKPT